MPITQALCKKSCWDNINCRYFYQGTTYEIDTESPIANLAHTWQFPKVEAPTVVTSTEAAPPSAPAVKAASATVAKES